MYRPPAFAVDDLARLHAFIRERVFATVAVVLDGEVQFAYAPVVLDAANNAVRFHLASNNALAQMPDGTRVQMTFVGPDAYISPDWYRTAGMVPTWNYLAVEGRGAARRLDGPALRQLLVDLTAAEETKLAPKQPWTIDKVPEPKLTTLLNAIVGFEVAFDSLEGKFKLSQNIKPEDFEDAAHGLEARGDAASIAVARAMRALKR